MIPRTGGLHIINDTNIPYLTGFHSKGPGNPTVNDEISFSIPVNDSLYGSIACGVVVLSENDFKTVTFYELPYNEDTLEVDGRLPQLRPGTYSYILYAYDYAQNYVYISWVNSMEFTISFPYTLILLLTVNVGLIGFVGYFIFKKYRENLIT